MDATFWIWFGNESTALHLAVDKATKKVLSGWFDYEETTEAYTIVLMKMVVNYGRPKLVRTSRVHHCLAIKFNVSSVDILFSSFHFLVILW